MACTKRVFVFTSAGKPIFYNDGNENEMVTTFGLLQAIISVVSDSGDTIHSIKAGSRKRIVYFLRDSLYFVTVASTDEPELVLRRQLEFVYTYILLVLTKKIHELLRLNPSRDVRELIGNDTSKLMIAAVPPDICPPCIAFNAVSGCVIDENFRTEFFANLKWCVEQSEAALGLLLLNDKLLAYVIDGSGQLIPKTSDILLITHMVAHSPSLQSYAPSYIPICLPGFNSNGYLQAYVSAIALGSAFPAPADIPVAIASPSVSSSQAVDLEAASACPTISLVLISTNNDSDQFRKLHDGRLLLQEALGGKDTQQRLTTASSLSNRALCSYATPFSILHFFCRYRPASPRLPEQCHWIPFSFPLDCIDSQQRIWAEYQRIAVCLRAGSSHPGLTLLPSNGETSATSWEVSAEHNTAYSIFESGLVIVGLANDRLELHATFPATTKAMAACELASALAKQLEADAINLFQISET